MKFHSPSMTYMPKRIKRWEMHLSLTVVPLPFDIVAPVVAGITRVREGPVGRTVGERMPPLLWLDEMRKREDTATKRAGDPPGIPLFNGNLIWQPLENAGVTVVEHPLDNVGRDGLNMDIARLFHDVALTSFDSILETTKRQHNEITVRRGHAVLRRVSSSCGWISAGWEWTEEGAPQPFEDVSTYGARSIKARLDRKAICACLDRLGVDVERGLFQRDFAQSMHIWPLPYMEPGAASMECNDYEDEAARARAAGVKSALASDIMATDFEKHASFVSDQIRWEGILNKAQYQALMSAERAKTPAGRLRAQWRVVETLKEVQREVAAAGHTGRVARAFSFQIGLNAAMTELGKGTEPYNEFKRLHKSPFGVF